MTKTSKNNPAELEASLARNALKYDLMPYASNPFPQSAPARTAALAQLFGLAPASVEGARVLELGCASGGNIIPLAARYPDARFVGVDLSRTQVAAGRARIEALGLSNIEILCQSFTELGDDLGHFDYIICHGVYSWVPEPVQRAILEISSARLAPSGIAYVSYNVLPGWRMLQVLRDVLALGVPDNLDAPSRVQRARAMLGMMSELSPQAGPYGELIRTWNERFKGFPDDYLAHEFLEEDNAPCTLGAFLGAAEASGLNYLCDCDLPSMILSNHAPEVARRIQESVGNSLVGTEQWLDVLSGRTFRQSLLVGSETSARIQRNLSAERMEGLHFSTAPDLVLEAAAVGGAVTDSAGRRLTTDSDQVFAAVSLLVRRFPASSSLADLLATLPFSGRSSFEPAIADALFQMLLVGLVTPWATPLGAAASQPERPHASELARRDAERGLESTANLRHERVVIDPAARALLPALDGTRDRAALAEHMLAQARAGVITFNENHQPVTDPARMSMVADGMIDALLASIHRAGLIGDKGGL